MIHIYRVIPSPLLIIELSPNFQKASIRLHYTTLHSSIHCTVTEYLTSTTHTMTPHSPRLCLVSVMSIRLPLPVRREIPVLSWALDRQASQNACCLAGVLQRPRTFHQGSVQWGTRLLALLFSPLAQFRRQEPHAVLKKRGIYLSDRNYLALVHNRALCLVARPLEYRHFSFYLSRW